MAIQSNSLPPVSGYRVNPTLKQFLDRAETGRQALYWSGIKPAKIPQKSPNIDKINVRWDTFDRFLKIADYNEHTGQMSAFCAPQFRRNASKTTGDGQRPYPHNVDMV
jgi:hypothetical protein